MGIGGNAKVLGKVEMPSGVGGVSVVDRPGVPPLTPVSLFKNGRCRDRLEQQHDGSQENRDDDLLECLAKRPCGS